MKYGKLVSSHRHSNTTGPLVGHSKLKGGLPCAAHCIGPAAEASPSKSLCCSLIETQYGAALYSVGTSALSLLNGG